MSGFAHRIVPPILTRSARSAGNPRKSADLAPQIDILGYYPRPILAGPYRHGLETVSARSQVARTFTRRRASCSCSSAAAPMLGSERNRGTMLTGGLVKRLLPSAVGIAALAVAAAAFGAPNAAMSARLVGVTSPAKRNAYAALVAHVVPARRCTIAVLYKSGPSKARGLNPKRPVNGYVSWKWTVGRNTTLGTWPIQVSCGSAGSFRTHFKVIR
jgi:hypothetical protein